MGDDHEIPIMKAIREDLIFTRDRCGAPGSEIRRRAEVTLELLDDRERLKAALRTERARAEAATAEAKARMEAARYLNDAGLIEAQHDDSCPEDDTCDCEDVLPYRVMLNDGPYFDEALAAWRKAARP